MMVSAREATCPRRQHQPGNHCHAVLSSSTLTHAAAALAQTGRPAEKLHNADSKRPGSSAHGAGDHLLFEIATTMVFVTVPSGDTSCSKAHAARRPADAEMVDQHIGSPDARIGDRWYQLRAMLHGCSFRCCCGRRAVTFIAVSNALGCGWRIQGWAVAISARAWRLHRAGALPDSNTQIQRRLTDRHLERKTPWLRFRAGGQQRTRACFDGVTENSRDLIRAGDGPATGPYRLHQSSVVSQPNALGLKPPSILAISYSDSATARRHCRMFGTQHAGTARQVNPPPPRNRAAGRWRNTGTGALTFLVVRIDLRRFGVKSGGRQATLVHIGGLNNLASRPLIAGRQPGCSRSVTRPARKQSARQQCTSPA